MLTKDNFLRTTEEFADIGSKPVTPKVSHVYIYIYIHTHTWASWVALVVKNLLANAGDARDAGLISGPGRSPGVGKGNPLQYSCLENSMDRGTDRLQSMGSQRVGHD